MKGKLLLIDDDVELCEEITEILTDEGFKVDIVHDGQTGFDSVKTGNYDIILLDLKIPVLNGVELLRKIRNEKIKTKIIVLTGRPISKNAEIELSKDKEEDNFIINNSDEILNKPYVIEDLLSKLNSLLKK